MKSCPQCNTKCVNSAVTCDCGFAFVDGADTPTPPSASPETAESLNVQKAPTRTYDVLLCVFGLLSLLAHFASPVAIILVSLAFFFWSRREGKKTWYRTVGLVAAIISLGCTVFYLGLALLVWLHIMMQ